MPKLNKKEKKNTASSGARRNERGKKLLERKKAYIKIFPFYHDPFFRVRHPGLVRVFYSSYSVEWKLVIRVVNLPGT